MCTVEDTSTPECGSPEFRSRSLMLWCYDGKRRYVLKASFAVALPSELLLWESWAEQGDPAL